MAVAAWRVAVAVAVAVAVFCGLWLWPWLCGCGHGCVAVWLSLWLGLWLWLVGAVVSVWCRVVVRCGGWGGAVGVWGLIEVIIVY